MDMESYSPRGAKTNASLQALRSNPPQLDVEPESDLFHPFQNVQDQPEINTYAQNISTSFKLLRYFMLFILKFPFHFQQDTNGPGTFEYTCPIKNFRTIGFLMTIVFLSIILSLNVINYFGLLLNYPTQEPYLYDMKYWRNLHDEEMYLIHRNNSHVIAIFSHLVHVVLGSWMLFIKRDLVAKYLAFWSSAVEILGIDVAKGGQTKRYMKIATWIYIGSCVLIIVLNVLHFIPAMNGASAMFTILTLRTFSPSLHIQPSFGILRTLFAIILLYVRICSNVYILFYLFHCILLTNAFMEWNRRLKIGLFKRPAMSRYSVFKQLTKSKTNHITHQTEALPRQFHRTSLEYLYKDYHFLIRIIEATDEVFSTILLTYYGSQIMATCFQIFELYNALLNKDEYSGTRRLDAIAMFIFTVQSMVLLFVVSRYAARVGSQATEGLEVLRAKGILGKKTPEEAYFMLSMSESYDGYFGAGLTGGNFFSMDKTFVVTIGGTLFTYVILIIQFTYIFKTNFEDDMAALKKPSNSTLILHDMLKHVEGTLDIFGFNPEF